MKNLRFVILNAMSIAMLLFIVIACTQMKQEIADPAPVFKYDQGAVAAGSGILVTYAI